MDRRIKGAYTEKEWEACRHFRIFASVHRLLILGVMKESPQCRVTQLVMETGLSYRQVYYELSVLRKIGYVYCVHHKGRYLVRFSEGWHNKGSRLSEIFDDSYEPVDSGKADAKERTFLRIEK